MAIARIRHTPIPHRRGAAAEKTLGSMIAKGITAKGRAIIHDDQATKDWFYPAFGGRNPDKEAAERFVKQLDSPLRVVIEVKPTKWIEFDAAKFGLDAVGQLPDDQKGPMHSADSSRCSTSCASS